MISNIKKVARKGYNIIDNKTGQVVAAGGTLMASAGSAMAALPTAVTDAFTTATTDGTALAYLWVGFVVTIGAIFYLKRRGG